MKTIECDECEKTIEGYTQRQIEYMLRQHKMAKHNKDHKKRGMKNEKIY